MAGGGQSNSGSATSKTVDIAMVTFATGIPYFDEAYRGAQKAAKRLGLEIGYYGPPSNDTAGEIALIDDLITRGIKGMIVTAVDSKAVVPVLQKAMKAGIKVVTFDLDVDPAGRHLYAGLKELDEMGPWMVDLMYNAYAPVLGNSFEYAIITSSLTSELMINRVKSMISYASSKYPGLKCLGYEAGDADPQKAYNVAVTLMTANPSMKVILSNSSETLAPICEAIAAEGKIGKVYGTGMTTPNLAKAGYLNGTILGGAMLWAPGTWAEFAITVCNELIKGTQFKQGGNWSVPGFPNVEMVSESVIVYSGLQEFTKENINDFDF
jgi:rhamnose transport system substrate-binding protein